MAGDYCSKGHKYEFGEFECRVCRAAEEAEMALEQAEDTASQLEEALDFILDNEFGGCEVEGGGGVIPSCLSCGAQMSTDHSKTCRWLAIVQRAGRR